MFVHTGNIKPALQLCCVQVIFKGKTWNLVQKKETKKTKLWRMTGFKYRNIETTLMFMVLVIKQNVLCEI